MIEKQMKELAEIVKQQAEMQSFWLSKPTINEHLLQVALRHLHAVIENDPVTAAKMKKEYWDLESEM